jgi:hypothetical protein
MKRLIFFLVAALLLPALHSPAMGDGVCTPSGWCRLHFSNFSPVFLYPVDTFGRFRRYWFRDDSVLNRNLIDCSNGMLSINEGPMLQLSPRGIDYEIYQSICLRQNRFVFPSAPPGGFGAWPPAPPF